jgi:hypothetical protein
MCVLPALHLKVHAAIEKGLVDEQSFFCVQISFAIGCNYFALGGILFLQLHGLTDEHSLA